MFVCVCPLCLFVSVCCVRLCLFIVFLCVCLLCFFASVYCVSLCISARLATYDCDSVGVRGGAAGRGAGPPWREEFPFVRKCSLRRGFPLQGSSPYEEISPFTGFPLLLDARRAARWGPPPAHSFCLPASPGASFPGARHPIIDYKITSKLLLECI